MQIQMIEVSEPYKEGQTFKIKMKYSREGKETERKLADVGDSKKAFATMRLAKPGEIYEIDLVKNGDFQNWVNATKLDGSIGQQPIKASTLNTKSTYETPEERARRQILIVRQSSFAQAVVIAGIGEQNVDNISTIAEQIENWVLRPSVPIVADGFKDDIPF